MNLSSSLAANDRARWDRLADQYLPPRALWPTLTPLPDGRRYPAWLNLAQELLAVADLAPRATAILAAAERVSYGRLRDEVLDAAGALAALGVQPADRVALRFHNTRAFVVTWLAVQWVGAIGVPIPAMYRRREIAHIVNHSGARIVIASSDLAADVAAAAPRFSNGTVAIVTALHDRLVPPPAYPTPHDAPALITYITGAGGTLKGIVHSPAELLATADTYARHVLDLSPRDVCIGLPPMTWSFGLGGLLVFPLRAGASTVLVDPAGSPLPAVLADTRATVLFATPTMYRLLLRQPDVDRFDFSSLRCCVSAAEPLPAAAFRDWQRRTGVDILDGLGTTELGHIVISSRPGQVHAGSMGRVVPGYRARIVDACGQEAPPGVAGLLAIQGPTGARYWRDHEAQRQTVREGWTLTGDVCTQDDGGWFTHVRRADDLIVSGGCKISPREVERALQDHPDVASARVFAVDDALRGSLPHAEVRLRHGADPAGAAERLQQYLKEELAPYKCPRAINVSG